MDLALLTGLRRENLVTLSRKNDTKEGLKVKTLKGSKWLLFTWTPQLRAVVDRGYALWPRKHPTPIDQPILVLRDANPLPARTMAGIRCRSRRGSSSRRADGVVHAS